LREEFVSVLFFFIIYFLFKFFGFSYEDFDEDGEG
jgi:hypothetical protein